MVARFIQLRRLATVMCGLAAVLVGGGATAQGRLDAQYVVTLAGVPIGQGAWIIDFRADQYIATANGKTTGLLRIFANGEGATTARGHVNNGRPIPSSYTSRITTDRKSEELRITLAGGSVKEFSINPPSPPNPDRIPVTEAHRHGVADPMSATLTHVAGTADPVSPEACNRTVSIFDGRLRYDLKLAFKRMEVVRSEGGYQGPAVACAVYFVPIAGYVPERAAVKYLVAQRDMEVWLAPVAGTRIVVPYRLSVPTPLGLGLLQATRFVTAAQPRESAFNAKTH